MDDSAPHTDGPSRREASTPESPARDGSAPSAASALSAILASNALRTLPSTDSVMWALRSALAERSARSNYTEHREYAEGDESPAKPVLIWAARKAIAEARAGIKAGGTAPSTDEIVARALLLLSDRLRPTLRPVINATGILINTNLGRAPLGDDAIAALAAVARGYSNLEFDLEAGERGSRQSHVRDLLRELTGAEDALVVNNNAAAVLVVLSALASGREVIISRGELVEIGGGFRVPDVMRQSGARLVEVGTTNRTRASDYAAAIGPETALLLAVHPSNFRVIGFTETPTLAELASVARERGLPLMHDLGSGALVATETWGLRHEPTPGESLAAGCDIVCISGDKLLGGPQAGIILGRASLLARIARLPLMRAIRSDKLTLAALEATLRSYRDGTQLLSVPLLQMLATPLAILRARAEKWAARLREWGIPAQAQPGESAVGGGSLPGETLPTVLCAIGPCADQQGTVDVAQVAARLRTGDPPVIGRVLRDHLLLDPRTVAPVDDANLLAALERAIHDIPRLTRSKPTRKNS